MGVGHVSNCLEQVLCNMQRAFYIGIWQNNGKFFAPVARDQVAGTLKALLYGLRHAAEAAVAGEVAVCVIVALKKVYVRQ